MNSTLIEQCPFFAMPTVHVAVDFATCIVHNLSTMILVGPHRPNRCCRAYSRILTRDWPRKHASIHLYDYAIFCKSGYSGRVHLLTYNPLKLRGWGRRTWETSVGPRTTCEFTHCQAVAVGTDSLCRIFCQCTHACTNSVHREVVESGPRVNVGPCKM